LPKLRSQRASFDRSRIFVAGVGIWQRAIPISTPEPLLAAARGWMSNTPGGAGHAEPGAAAERRIHARHTLSEGAVRRSTNSRWA
jgi:hypothetical protein